MKKDFIPFLIKLSIYCILVYAAFLLVRTNIPEKFLYENIAYLVIFFFFVTAVFHLGMLRNAAKNSRSIVSFFMLATVLKFLLYLVIMIGYSLLNPGKTTAFISSFFAIYVFLTIFEVSVIYSYFKGKTTEKQGN